MVLPILSATLDEFMSPLSSLFDTPATYQGPDFSSFIIKELPYQGVPKFITLSGKMLPHQPFTTGGKQRLIKEYYPGNPEAAVQVLGGVDDNVTIKGRLYAKHYRGTPTFPVDRLRTVPTVMRDEIDGMRKRGNLVEISLGKWKRWGWIERCSFNLKTVADIDYEIEFFIIGDSLPSKCKITDDVNFSVIALNTDLIAAALAFESIALQGPADFPGTLFDQINKLVSTVATAVSVLTKFIDQVVKTAENAQKTANKALGLLKHIAATIAQFKRRVGFLALYDVSVQSETKKITHAKYILGVQKSTSKPPVLVTAAMRERATPLAPNYSTEAASQEKALGKLGNTTLETTLLRLKQQFETLALTIPIARHLVRSGDTLQGIAVKFYKDSAAWKTIYDHNKLSSTVLTPGVILEIPRLARN